MEKRGSRSKLDRREIHSVCMTVPTIVLNASSSEKTDQGALSHSRSAGDLDMSIADSVEQKTSVKKEGISRFSNSVADSIHDPESRNVIGLYCSPRMTRRSINSDISGLQQKQPGNFLDSLNACNLNSLDPGSRVGSTVSLNSEYTSRSIGLISNDSSSECSQHLYQTGIMEGSFQKHSVLKRFYSTPEKDDDLLQHTTNVRRNSKSLGNMQGEKDNFVCFDFGSDSTDDNIQPMETLNCDIDDSLEKRTSVEIGDASAPDANLVTAVTGNATLREGRIRKWLTEITVPDENSNS